MGEALNVHLGLQYRHYDSGLLIRLTQKSSEPFLWDLNKHRPTIVLQMEAGGGRLEAERAEKVYNQAAKCGTTTY